MLHFSLNPLRALVYRFLFNVSLNTCYTLEASGSKADSIWIKVGRTRCTSLPQFNSFPVGLELKRELWAVPLLTSSTGLTNQKSTWTYSMRATFEQTEVVLRPAQVCCNVRHNSMTPVKGGISGTGETSVPYNHITYITMYSSSRTLEPWDKARLRHECSGMWH